MPTDPVRRGPAVLAVALLLVAIAGPAAAVPWFPSDPGPTFTYSYGTVVISDGGPPADFHRSRCTASAPWVCEAQLFRVDDDGDILYLSRGISSPAMPDPDVTTYDAPLKYLDFPLETGRQWNSSAGIVVAAWDPQAPTVPVTLFGAVVGPATVTVPAGTFEVIKVHLLFICTDQPWRNWTRELWLNHSLGPVNDLVSWTGVVDVESVSWGSLKAGYR